MGQTRIALDVMGGDRAPVANLSAALKAVGDGGSGLDPARVVLLPEGFAKDLVLPGAARCQKGEGCGEDQTRRG